LYFDFIRWGFPVNFYDTVSLVDTLKTSRDMISDETIVSLHPMVENTTYEYQKLLEQREERAKKVVDLSKVDIYE